MSDPNFWWGFVAGWIVGIAVAWATAEWAIRSAAKEIAARPAVSAEPKEEQ